MCFLKLTLSAFLFKNTELYTELNSGYNPGEKRFESSEISLEIK